jgi:glutamyl-tRNA reductase
MNLLVVGVSHHTAPVELLERLSVSAEATPPMLKGLVGLPHVNEAVVLSTCNRVEVYAAVPAFHGGLTEISAVLADRAGLDVAMLASHLRVHYDTEAVRHAFRVAAGLDSMIIGEAQILGQLRDAYGRAAESDTTGRLLHELMQQALRVGKRVHAETGIDRDGQSVVTAALALAPDGIAGRTILVVGAGSMGALALATLARAGGGPLLVANRGAERAQRLANMHGAGVVDLGEIPAALSTVDVVVCATASPGHVLTEETVAAALRGRRDGHSLVIFDLAVPRDVAPEVAKLPGVTLVDLALLSGARRDEPSGNDRNAAQSIVSAEADAFLTWLRDAEVAPTVAALRARADQVVGVELRRLNQRRPDLTEVQRAAVAHAVHRVVRQLLHPPTMRVRQLAATEGGDKYAAVLRELFDLSVPPSHVDVPRAVTIEPSRTGRMDHGDAEDWQPRQRAGSASVANGRRRRDDNDLGSNGGFN